MKDQTWIAISRPTSNVWDSSTEVRTPKHFHQMNLRDRTDRAGSAEEQAPDFRMEPEA